MLRGLPMNHRVLWSGGGFGDGKAEGGGHFVEIANGLLTVEFLIVGNAAFDILHAFGHRVVVKFGQFAGHCRGRHCRTLPGLACCQTGTPRPPACKEARPGSQASPNHQTQATRTSLSNGQNHCTKPEPVTLRAKAEDYSTVHPVPLNTFLYFGTSA